MVLLIKGSDITIDGSVSLARRFKISELIIGLTIVAFGTSSPELVVSLSAAVSSHPEISFGNVIGSNNFNLLLILGITGLVSPVAVQKNTAWIEIPFSMLSAIILLLLANFAVFSGERNVLSRLDGIILLVFFALFLFYVFNSIKINTVIEKNEPAELYSLGKSIILVILGLTFLVIGGKLVVNSAVKLAQALHISEKVISLTIVAGGTSLPELIVSVAAVIKKKDDIAMGNIIGSNIFNILFILGLSAVVRPLEYTPVFNIYLYLLIFCTLLLFIAMFTGKKMKLDRWEAAVFVVIYTGYIVYLIRRN